jgi:hypothetical protein
VHKKEKALILMLMTTMRSKLFVWLCLTCTSTFARNALDGFQESAGWR